MKGYVSNGNRNYKYKEIFSDKLNPIMKNIVLVRKPENK